MSKKINNIPREERTGEKMSKKKKVILAVIVVLVIATIGVGLYYFITQKEKGTKNKIFVEKVSDLISQPQGNTNNFTGVVESQETVDVSLDASRKLSEIYVNVGDVVTVGSKLLSYDTKELTMQIEQGKLEIEGISNEIKDFQVQIATLTAEKAKVPKESQFEYTTQIQSVQNSIKQSDYNFKNKKLELEKSKQDIEKSTIVSKIDGVIKSVNKNGTDSQGSEAPVVVITSKGSYRIKGFISEMYVAQMQVGLPVTIYSRVDENASWSGVIEKVEVDSPQKTGEEGMQEGGSPEQASRYPFYITLTDATGLMLGQHVYVQLGEKTEQSQQFKGVAIYGSYLIQEGEQSFVWMEDSKGYLTKQKIKVNLIDEEQDLYEVTKGLKKSDYIAFPMGSIKKGMKTIRTSDQGVEK